MGSFLKLLEKKTILLKDAMDLFLRSEDKWKKLSDKQLQFARAIAKAKRFGELSLRNYVDLYHLEGTDTDFSALEICLSDTSVYTAFRGTGGTLLGWREDFSMSYQIMPAQ